jgi:hypothetical protein
VVGERRRRGERPAQRWSNRCGGAKEERGGGGDDRERGHRGGWIGLWWDPPGVGGEKSGNKSL